VAGGTGLRTLARHHGGVLARARSRLKWHPDAIRAMGKKHGIEAGGTPRSGGDRPVPAMGAPWCFPAQRRANGMRAQRVLKGAEGASSNSLKKWQQIRQRIRILAPDRCTSSPKARRLCLMIVVQKQ